jgi:hypothetical protein
MQNIVRFDLNSSYYAPIILYPHFMYYFLADYCNPIMPNQDFSAQNALEAFCSLSNISDSEARKMLGQFVMSPNAMIANYGECKLQNFLSWMSEILCHASYMKKSSLLEQLRTIIREETALFAALANVERTPWAKLPEDANISYSEFKEWWDSAEKSWIWHRSSRTMLQKVGLFPCMLSMLFTIFHAFMSYAADGARFQEC